MSYNIDTFYVKRLVDLRIPVAAFYKHERTDWHPEPDLSQTQNADNVRIVDGAEGLEITGNVREGLLHVQTFDIFGEGSGTFMEWILIPALKESFGELAATMIWEGGDSISKLLVENGEVEEIQVDIADI